MTISTSSWLKQSRNIINGHYLSKRLNLKFITGIIKKISHESKCKHEPWLTADSVRILDGWISQNDKILEFGSGQSTTWFTTKSKHVISIEHDKDWYQKTKNIPGAKVILCKTKDKHLSILKKIKNDSIDACLVDGQWRRDCLLEVFSKIKPGGIIILDNAETILPISWPSQSFQDSWQKQGAQEKVKTKKIIKELKKWRQLSTSDVTQDTVIYVKKYSNN